jgi:two-component system, NtrC family, sensor kinase
VQKATLLVIRGTEQGERFELTDKTFSLGRGFRNDLRILDTEISRNHATIRFVDDAYTVKDQKSSNGTFVNGISVESHRLNSGDQVQVGNTTLLFTEIDDHAKPVAVDFVGEFGSDEADQIVGSMAWEADRKLFDIQRPDDASQTVANLKLLYKISEELVSSTLTIEQLLQRILDTTLKAVGADRGCVLITDPQTGQMEPRAAAHRDPTATARMPVSRSIVDFVVKKGQSVRTSDARADSRFAKGVSIVREGIREAMCVPMPGRYELMGVMYVDTQTPPNLLEQTVTNKFTDELLSLLAAIGRQAALAIEDHRYRDAYVKAERFAAIGQTITTMSHHIKNILQGVKGGGYLIAMGLKKHDDSLIEDGWNVVEKNQDRIYNLVMDMLTFSKEREPEFTPGNINDVAEDVCELMQARAEEFKVNLQMKLDEAAPTSSFDADAIHRATLNLVTNALEALDDSGNGAVEVRTGFIEESGEIWIEVADNGPGIAEDQIDNLFNLFESTKGSRGTGIGLAVSEKIAREHGGEIIVDSKLNRGSRFRMIWPKHD